jgi:hypothetical protein
MAESWRRLHNEELHKLYTSPTVRAIVSRTMKLSEHVARMGVINAYKIFVGKLEGKRLLGRPRCRWEDNIKVDITEIGWESADWIQLAQYRDQ